MFSVLIWVGVTWLYTSIKIHQAAYVRFLRFAHCVICRPYLLKGKKPQILEKRHEHFGVGITSVWPVPSTFTKRAMGMQADWALLKSAPSKSATKITTSQVCSFLFFQMGKAQAFFTSPARGNLSQTFHRDSPLGRHQTWTFSTREKLLGSSRLLQSDGWEGNGGRAPLPHLASP